MANPWSDYSKSIEGSLLDGNATEHTHRPALKTLIGALAAGVKAINGVPPEVWRFQVGGNQPCPKWLKDRAGRKLTYDDLTHYQRIVVALKETTRLMAEIDATIPAWPIR